MLTLLIYCASSTGIMESNTGTSTAMEWNSELDELLLQEIIICEPFQHKPFTRDRGKVWEEISEHLNEYPAFKNKLKQRSVRDRYSLLAKKFMRREAQEERASGISPPELTAVEKLLSELVEKFREADMTGDDKATKKKAEQSKMKGEEMRRMSMEKLGETSKRRKESSGEETTPKRSRASGRETLVYLREKGERELAMKKEEMAMLVKESEQRDKIQETLLQQQQATQQLFANMFDQFQRQQQQQQEQWQQQKQQWQQQQQQQLQFQQQQQLLQSKLLMSLIEKLNQQ